jgi:hypothetical protein
MTIVSRVLSILAVSLIVAGFPPEAVAGGAHDTPHAAPPANAGQDDAGRRQMLETMRQSHGAHQHGHDFEAMEKMSSAELTRVVALLQDIGLVVPQMDPANGRKLFVETGCVVCHSVNGVGGEVGPSLNAADMPDPMNAFDFAARMWRGAAAMSAMQEDLLGEVISLNGQQLADLVAFAHDTTEQKNLTANQIPEKFHKLMEN